MHVVVTLHHIKNAFLRGCRILTQMVLIDQVIHVEVSLSDSMRSVLILTAGAPSGQSSRERWHS